MEKIKTFFKTTVLGGLLVILPVTILLAAAIWIFNFVTRLIHPLTDLLLRQSPMNKRIADVLVILILLGVCFIAGVFVRTRLGKIIYEFIDARILKKAPGYSIIKETLAQFLGSKKSPFSSVALAQIFGNETLATVFITDTHKDGSYTVFVPTGLTPPSGNIYHLEGRLVHPVDVPVEEAMTSIISCGAGSTGLLKALPPGVPVRLPLDRHPCSGES